MVKWRMIGTVGFMLAVYTLFQLYIGWHGYIFLQHTVSAAMPLLFVCAFGLVAYGYLLGRMVPGPAGRLLKVVGAWYLAVFEFAVILLPIADLAAWLLDLSGVRPGVYVPVLGYVVLIVLAAALARGSWNAWSPYVRSHNIRIDKQAPERARLTVAVVSDVHLGNIVGRRHLERLIRHMDEMKPDLILLAGDVIDDSIEPFIRNRMGEVLGRLRAPLGVYAVLGNHEYYGGHIDKYMKQMNDIGIRVLTDETVLVGELLYVVGRKDKTADSFDGRSRLTVEQLTADIDKNKPVIAMDHQPREFAKAEAAGIDLLLSGHTHRGQFAPNHWITRRLFELDWGYVRHKRMHAVVSSGFGTWGPPIRLASRSEIVRLELEFG